MHMMRGFTVCGPIVFFHVRAVSGQEGISCGRLCFRKRDKRRLSIQGAILRLIYSPIGLFVDENKMELYMENQTRNITAIIMQLLLP